VKAFEEAGTVDHAALGRRLDAMRRTTIATLAMSNAATARRG
jgi:hypothetical protein